MGLAEDIKKTIKYSEKFNCQLNNIEIKERLISNKIYSDEEISETLSRLKSVSPLKRAIYADEKIKEAKKFVKLIKKKFKDILYIGVTGSVAAGYPDKNSDIDLIIITKSNKLWITRLKMRWFIYKNQIPHRKYGQKENKNELCFNFWLDEDNLKLTKDRQTLRCAMDLILMKPIMDKKNTYEKFILNNDWAKKWVATGYGLKTKPFMKNPPLTPPLKMEEKKIFYFNYFFNLLFFVPQYIFMKEKIKSEKVGLGYALFNEKRKTVDKAV